MGTIGRDGPTSGGYDEQNSGDAARGGGDHAEWVHPTEADDDVSAHGRDLSGHREGEYQRTVRPLDAQKKTLYAQRLHNCQDGDQNRNRNGRNQAARSAGSRGLQTRGTIWPGTPGTRRSSALR